MRLHGNINFYTKSPHLICLATAFHQNFNEWAALVFSHSNGAWHDVIRFMDIVRNSACTVKCGYKFCSFSQKLKLIEIVFCILLPFSTTYLCETAFSSITQIKIKHRGCLQAIENDLRVCLSTVVHARIETLSQSLQSQPAH